MRKNDRRARLAARAPALIGRIGFTFALLAAALPAGAAGPVRFVLQPQSRLWLTGSSTLHEYTCRATELTGFVTTAQAPAEGAAGWEALLQGAALSGAQVTVPVLSLKSGKGGLDKNLYKALKAPEAPVIRFDLAQRTVRAKDKPGEFSVDLAGALTVAGQTREVTVTADAVATPDGLRLQGTKELLMKDYGVKPPKMMLGAVKVDNKVAVHFDVLFGPDKTATQ